MTCVLFENWKYKYLHIYLILHFLPLSDLEVNISALLQIHCFAFALSFHENCTKLNVNSGNVHEHKYPLDSGL